MLTELTFITVKATGGYTTPRGTTAGVPAVVCRWG